MFPYQTFCFLLIRPYIFFIQDFRWDYLSPKLFLNFINSVKRNSATLLALRVFGGSHLIETVGYGYRYPKILVLVVSMTSVLAFIFLLDLILTPLYTLVVYMREHHRTFIRRALTIGHQDLRISLNSRSLFFIEVLDTLVYTSLFAIYLAFYGLFLGSSLSSILQLGVYQSLYLGSYLSKHLGTYLIWYIPVSLSNLFTIGSSIYYDLCGMLRVLLLKVSFLILYLIQGRFLMLFALFTTTFLTLVLLYPNFHSTTLTDPLKELTSLVERAFSFLCARLGIALVRVARRRGQGSTSEGPEVGDTSLLNQIFSSRIQILRDPRNLDLNHTLDSRKVLLARYIRIRSLGQLALEKLKDDQRLLARLVDLQRQNPTVGTPLVDQIKRRIAVIKVALEKLAREDLRINDLARSGQEVQELLRREFSESRDLDSVQRTLNITSSELNARHQLVSTTSRLAQEYQLALERLAPFMG